ncbi:MAG: TIGR04013 family B12-binding domain/radical SAM domain-containing protein [Planctomycetes bacterium]|jgi:B12-binding domain/radical SAM domain protein|nr:TIGR04013 family B12-binding domain/radical SAM domain-containing protein [Planctomycetota bacterium]
MLTVVWAYRRTGKFAFHVLTGALETDPRTAAVPIEFANGVDAVVAAITNALAAPGARVLVGWSFYSPDAIEMTAELQAVKARIDDARVLHVCGGVHASAEPEATLRAGWDLVAIGEGERLVRDLVLCVQHGGDARAVPGVAALVDGVLRKNGRAERIALDDFPPFGPAHGRYGPIEITRGCIYACRFCQTPYFAGASFRHRSVANVREWARWLVGRGFRDFRFLTPTSLSYGTFAPEPDLAAVEALLAGVREDIGPDRKLWFGTFPSEVRPEHCSDASLRLLKRWVSNRALILGGQSGSDRVLASSARGHDSACIERAVALCVEHGFVPHVDFLLGLPGEEPDDVEATLALMDRLVTKGAKVHGHTFLPLPGTPFRKAPAGALSAEVRRRLRNLASKGQLYGQWEQQEVTAQAMVEVRSRQRRGGDSGGSDSSALNVR